MMTGMVGIRVYIIRPSCWCHQNHNANYVNQWDSCRQLFVFTRKWCPPWLVNSSIFLHRSLNEAEHTDH